MPNCAVPACRNRSFLSLQDLAKRDAAGDIPDLAAINKMDNEAIIEQLTQVRGIGRWTVEMLLIFRLGRPDVLPVDDSACAKALAIPSRRIAACR